MPSRDPLALAAVAEVAPGMVVGLGTGRAASRAVRALSEKVIREGIEITCVATSRATECLAEELGLRLLPMEDTAHLDLLFDGADEADPALRMIKGRGGAMTRERIVARATARRLYLLQREKMSPRLGTRASLPIEVIPFAKASVTERLRALGLNPEIRRDEAGRAAETDNANLILDAGLPAAADPESIAAALNALAGVVDHGLFLDEADELIVEAGEFGPIERVKRP